MRLRAGSLRWWQASLLTLAVAAAATVQASATAWAQTPVDPPEQEQPAAPPGGDVPTDLDAPRDPAPEGDDS
ncbi:MAG: hypothetical protein OXE79_10765, partial [Acidimicrobiaceae bacterium]|nr:hypothetical protein [Acidimicrobiaceae bacterium]